MRRIAGTLAAFVVLAAPAADAKRLTTAIVVGSNGRSAEVSATILPRDGMPPTELRGGFVLVYPLMERGLPAQPGRFYPIDRAFCGAWNIAATPRPQSCLRVSVRASVQLLASRLARFTSPPPRLVALVGAKRSVKAPDNYLTGIELAFARSSTATASPQPDRCLAVHARWSREGRPARFCLAARGAWANGRLYRYGLGVGAVADYLSGRSPYARRSRSCNVAPCR